MGHIILLLVLLHMDGHLEVRTSISILGFETVAECQMHLASMKRSVPYNVTIEKAECLSN